MIVNFSVALIAAIVGSLGFYNLNNFRLPTL